MRECCDLAGRQVTPRACWQAGQAHVADFDAHELGDGVAERGHHAANLTVAAFVDRQLDLALPGAIRVLLAAHKPHVLGRPRHAVVKHDAPAQTLQRIVAGNARNSHPVRLRDMVARMGHLEQEVAVVGQKDQPFAVRVQTSDRPQHRLSADVHQIRHHLPCVAVRVRARRNNPLRLVHRQVIALQRRPNNSVIEQNLIGFGVGFRAQFCDDLAVNAHPALSDPRLARPPRADPGGGEHFLQPFFHRVSSLQKSVRPAGRPHRRQAKAAARRLSSFAAA